jgi:hypothetical protein
MPLENLEVSDLQWRKARRSANNGACVEVAPVTGQIAVRDSKNPSGSWLRYPDQSWRYFLSSVKRGDFDVLML